MTSELQLAQSSPPSCEKLLEIVVNEDGSIAFVHDDDLKDLLSSAFPDMKTSRASYCEPRPDGKWFVDVSPLTKQNQIAVIADRRDLAIAAEVDWIKNYLENLSCQTKTGDAPSARGT